MRNLIKLGLGTALATTLLVSAGCKKKDELTALQKIDNAFAAAAKTKGDGNPALWKMADEDTTIYLYGTFHLLPDGDRWQTPEFRSALESSDTVYFEIDMSPENQMKMAGKLMGEAMYSDGRTLKDVLTADQYSKLKEVSENIGAPVGLMAGFKPWMASMNLQVMSLQNAGYDPMKGVELVIMETVEADGKAIGSLETIEDQIAAISAGTEKEQIEALMFGLETIDQTVERTDDLRAEWEDGDIAGLDVLMGEDVWGSKKTYEAMLVNRNRNWIPEIEKILDEPGTKFIAVGAGHLAGEDSVIKMLEKKGHTIEVVQ